MFKAALKIKYTFNTGLNIVVLYNVRVKNHIVRKYVAGGIKNLTRVLQIQKKSNLKSIETQCDPDRKPNNATI